MKATSEFQVWVAGTLQATEDTKKAALKDAAWYGSDGEEVVIVERKTIAEGKIVAPDNYVDWE